MQWAGLWTGGLASPCASPQEVEAREPERLGARSKTVPTSRSRESVRLTVMVLPVSLADVPDYLWWDGELRALDR
jgi:glucose-6-phosphate dehydrogenase assembly protein OpcA